MGVTTAISDVDSIHKTEYKVRDLNTVSVTLFPTRAQVSREIKGVELNRGTNEITIVGLSPTVDSDSIKLEGNGAATITDIAVELLPNREIFEGVYPDSDEESDSEDDDDEDDDEPEHDELHAAKESLTDLMDQLQLAEEEVSSALKRLDILDSYGNTLDRKRNIVIQDSLDTYKEQRVKAFEDQMIGTKRQRELNEKIDKAEKEVAKLQKQEDRQKAKANKEKEKRRKEKEKEKLAKERRKDETQKEKNRIRSERERFWPRMCYSVRITLEVSTFTPMSSRRASISSEAEVAKISVSEVEDRDGVPIECDLVLSYVTSSAYWSPSYDLQLSTTNATASLYFDAMLRNFTSETWSNCKVTLSTSQTTFAGLEDAIPTLTPWHIKLAHRSAYVSDNEIIHSHEEHQAFMSNQMQQRQGNAQKPWSEMFGLSEKPKKKAEVWTQIQSYAGNQLFGQQRLQQLQQQQQPPHPPQAPVPMLPPPPMANTAWQSMLASRPQGAGSAPPRAAAPGGMVGSSAFSASASRSGMRIAGQASAAYSRPEPVEDSAESESDREPDLDFEESLMEETGLTTTYDLPGLKTLAPKSAGSKQRVARVHFPNVVFSHTVVAKYKVVAYLKAKLKNNSKLTLLKGQAGLTLDGTFMGKTSLPRCSAGESFSLSLGVDPAIKVSYPKPEVRRATSGLFSKENSSVYVRTITLHNTRVAAGRAVSLLVLDQIPISEDERLRVELIDPRGLSVDGVGVATGVPGSQARDEQDWGKASAKLKKGGEVSWDVSLNAGKAVKLSLEYAVSLPSGDHAIQC